MNAKDWIDNILKHPNWCQTSIDWDSVFELASLIEKDTPKKVELKNNAYICPNCGGIMTFKHKGMCVSCQNEFCGGCGQRLDWSEIK